MMPRSSVLSQWLGAFTLVFLLTMAFPCAGEPAAAGETTAVQSRSGQIRTSSAGSLESGGIERAYRIYVPDSYDGTKPVPLVVAIHFGGGNAGILERLSGLNAVADKQGFIVVYPEGYRTAWGGPDLVTPSVRDGVDDARFISALIDKMADEYKIDSRRVYAVGMCNGGCFAQVLAYELSDKIAAVAVMTGFITKGFCEKYTVLPRPIPIIQINGTADTLILWEGGIPPGLGNNGLPIRFGIERWAKMNGCDSEPIVTQLPDLADDGTRIRREVYTGGKDGVEVVLYIVEGGGHTWPGGLQYASEERIGKTSRDTNASELIWQFFRKHPMPKAD